MKRLAILVLTFSLLVPVTYGQQAPDGPTAKDSVTVSVEALRNLRFEYRKLERKAEIQDSIIAEQEYQIDLYKRRLQQDSVIVDLTEERLKIKDERIKARDERIERLERQNTWEQIKKFAWSAGTLVIGFLLGSAS